MIEIIVALIAVFGGVLPYLFQKNKELNLKIADQKREAYASFLNNFTKVSVAASYDEDEKLSGKEADLERLLARDQLLLYGSDEVIKAYDTWIRFADNDEKHDYDQGFTPQLDLAHLNGESLHLVHGTEVGAHLVNAAVLGQPLHIPSPDRG